MKLTISRKKLHIYSFIMMITTTIKQKNDKENLNIFLISYTSHLSLINISSFYSPTLKMYNDVSILTIKMKIVEI